MPGILRWVVLIAVGVLPMAASLGQPPARHPKLRFLKEPVSKLRAPLPIPPSGPLPQVPMSELPATPPQVTYQNGLLTIVAENSSLGDILREVHKRTGAAIDVPANATERVATRLGPAPAQDVLADLLNGSAYNYVMVGSTGNPASLAKVVLTTKPAGGVTQTAYQPPPQQYVPPPMVPAPGMGPGGPVAQEVQSDDESEADQDGDASADEEQDQDQDQAGSVSPEGEGAQPNAGPKTPEQILEMLRQRQQAPPGQTPFPRINQNQPQSPENE